MMVRADTASLVIAAAPDDVFAAFVDPDALAAWLPLEGMSGRFERFDARSGGSYRVVLTSSDPSGAPGKSTAASDVVEARFVDIVPGDRVVQAIDFVSDDPAYAGTMTMTWGHRRRRRHPSRDPGRDRPTRQPQLFHPSGIGENK